MLHSIRHRVMKKKAKEKKIQEIRQIQKNQFERKKWQITGSSEFQPEYCQMLVNHCSEGYSFQSFAARVNVLPEVIKEWIEKYPEFANARSIAEVRRKFFWEKKAIEDCSNKFSISTFRHFTESTDKEAEVSVPEAVVLLPKEESSK